MAPTKFGLFKARSRDQSDQPSTDNTPTYHSEHETNPMSVTTMLNLKMLSEFDVHPELYARNLRNLGVNTLDSPVPSTSKGIVAQEEINPADIFPMLDLDDDDEEFTGIPRSRRASFSTNLEEQRVIYQSLQDESTSTINELNQIQIYDEPEGVEEYFEPEEVCDDEASTTYDAKSLLFDETSVTASEDSTYCAILKKPKKSRSKEQELKDLNMWQASNYEVMAEGAPGKQDKQTTQSESDNKDPSHGKKDENKITPSPVQLLE